MTDPVRDYIIAMIEKAEEAQAAGKMVLLEGVTDGERTITSVEPAPFIVHLRKLLSTKDKRTLH